MITRPLHWIRFLPLAILASGIAATQAFNLLTPEKEAAMGREVFSKYKKQKKMVRSGRQHQMTQRVGSRLSRVVSVPNAQWEFALFDDPSPNAFALPGGKVGVHTGIFKVAKNEAQLAAVIGHELGHVTARHSGERISNAMAGSVAGGIAGLILESKTGVNMRTAQGITQGAATLRLLKFSRKQELESDRLGAIYMARAGYDPVEAVNLWRQFAAYKTRTNKAAPPAFLSTHPVDNRRIDELQAFLPHARKHYSGNTRLTPATTATPPKARRYVP